MYCGIVLYLWPTKSHIFRVTAPASQVPLHNRYGTLQGELHNKEVHLCWRCPEVMSSYTLYKLLNQEKMMWEGNRRPNMQYWTHSVGQFAVSLGPGLNRKKKVPALYSPQTILPYIDFQVVKQWNSNKKSEDKCGWIQELGTIG